MLPLIINEQKRKLKNDFIDVTIAELVEAYEFVKTIPVAVKTHLLDDKPIEDEGLLIDFQISWVALFSDIPERDLRLVPLKMLSDSLSLEWMFNQCKKFLKAPESYIDLKEFKFQGTKYKLIEPLTTLSGAKMLFGTANYRQFMLCSQLANMVSENNITGLNQLAAILYTDGNEDTKEVAARAKKFQELNALYAWSAYFFFAMLLKRYNEFFQSFTSDRPNLKALKKWQLERLKLRLQRSFIGKLLPSKWLKVEYLILQD